MREASSGSWQTNRTTATPRVRQRLTHHHRSFHSTRRGSASLKRTKGITWSGQRLILVSPGDQMANEASVKRCPPTGTTGTFKKLNALMWYRAARDRNSSQALSFSRQISIQRGWSKSTDRLFFAKASRATARAKRVVSEIFPARRARLCASVRPPTVCTVPPASRPLPLVAMPAHPGHSRAP